MTGSVFRTTCATLALLLGACAPAPDTLQSTVAAAVAQTQAAQVTAAPLEVAAELPTLTVAPFPTATARIASGAGAPRAGADPTLAPTALPGAVVAPTVSVQTVLTATLRDHGNVQDRGTAALSLAANEVAIGTADLYQDNLGENNPAFTVFAIYGPYEGSLSLKWGGWDRWAAASPEFVAAQLEAKIAEVMAGHPDDWATRRIRVLECRGDVLACVVVRTTP